MKDLSALLSQSSSTRKYFVSLPVWLQMELHESHNYINNAGKLYVVSDILKKQAHLR